MPYTVLKNQNNGKVTLHVVGANSGNVITVGNSSVSNIATRSEILSGASIRKLKWGTDAVIIIKRDTTAVWYCTQSGELDFSDSCVLNMNKAANVQIDVSSANSSLTIELDKQFTTMTQEF